ncbi:MAG: pyrroline-5-carboxylate reductase [Planctomycetota bacterium]|nr:pyrroline-5-carboxylate reductase [Planctomycetota bacterium]
MSSLEGKRLAVLGVGKIGEAILRGLFTAGKVKKDQVSGSVASESSRDRAAKKLGIKVGLSNQEAAQGCDILLLSVKPQVMPSLLTDLKSLVSDETLIISVVASMTTEKIQSALGQNCPVLRVMPNTPCLVGEGMSVICAGTYANQGHIELAQELFGSCGKTAVLKESLMDAVTGLSGSGPAYIYLVIESLAEAGVKVGIPRDVSTLLSAQTVLGASSMVLESKAHPALLKDAVTTPAGCTVDGLLELEEGKLRVTLIKAVVKAAERAAQLSP